MTGWLMVALVLLSPPAMAQQSVPEIPFESVPDPLKFPADLYLGEATGVAVNSNGHVFVFSRGNTTGPAYAASAAQLLEFGPDGQFIREIGKNSLFGEVRKQDVGCHRFSPYYVRIPLSRLSSIESFDHFVGGRRAAGLWVASQRPAFCCPGCKISFCTRQFNSSAT